MAKPRITDEEILKRIRDIQDKHNILRDTAPPQRCMDPKLIYLIHYRGGNTYLQKLGLKTRQSKIQKWTEERVMNEVFALHSKLGLPDGIPPTCLQMGNRLKNALARFGGNDLLEKYDFETRNMGEKANARNPKPKTKKQPKRPIEPLIKVLSEAKESGQTYGKYLARQDKAYADMMDEAKAKFTEMFGEVAV